MKAFADGAEKRLRTALRPRQIGYLKLVQLGAVRKNARKLKEKARLSLPSRLSTDSSWLEVGAHLGAKWSSCWHQSGRLLDGISNVFFVFLRVFVRPILARNGAHLGTKLDAV